MLIKPLPPRKPDERPVWRSEILDRPHRLDWMDEPDTIGAGTAHHGCSIGEAHIVRGVFLRIAVGDGSRVVIVTEGTRGGTVCCIGRARDVEVLWLAKRRRDLERARSTFRDNGQVLGAIAESWPLSVWQVLGRRGGGQGHWRIPTGVEVVEHGEGWGPDRLVPPHARPEFGDCVNREVHQCKRGRQITLELARNVHGVQATRNLLNGANSQASKVGGTDLREEALHDQSNCVVVSNDDQGTGRTMGLFQVLDREPEEPRAQRPQALKLLGYRQGWADLASTLQEADKLSNGLCVLPVVLEVRLDLLELLQSPLEGVKVLLARLAGLVVRSGRRGSGWERAAFGNEITELRLVLPGVHSLNDLLSPRQHLCLFVTA